MKYIRTENGIFKVEREETLCGVKFYDYDTGEYLNRIREEHTIAQADTIEELCDEFVLVDETLPPHLDRDLKEIKMYKTYIAGSRGDVYGAIWTSKGLIYVAKINEKEELELI